MNIFTDYYFYCYYYYYSSYDLPRKPVFDTVETKPKEPQISHLLDLRAPALFQIIEPGNPKTVGLWACL